VYSEDADKKIRKNESSRHGIAAVGLIAVLIIGALAGSMATYKTGRSLFGMARTAPFYVASSDDQAAGQTPFATFAPIVKSVLPAVVNISSSRVVRQASSPSPDDPFFSIPRERREQSLGSGVIVSPEGYLLTNNHVVEAATDVRVVLSDKREFKARIIGTDPQTDIAVLKVDAANLQAIPMGDSTKVQVGDVELAIGNPFGLGQTVTMGIVSATGRGNLGIEDYEDFIQTDAAINPGNSGGALINTHGELIGINTAILSNGAEGNQGIGFAVPINMTRRSMEQILKNGKVIRGWLGISIQEVTPFIAKALGLDGPRGALVGDVAPDSPAATAGMSRGDIIIELNGEPVSDGRSLRLKIADTAPGTTLRLRLFRDRSEREVSVTLGEHPSEAQRAGASDSGNGPLAGIAVDELTPEVARQLGLAAGTRGVVIVEVQSDSPAADAGLRRGDVIQELNRKPIGDVNEFQQAMSQAGNGQVLLLINRGGNTVFIAVETR
jgi:serine protease Do